MVAAAQRCLRRCDDVCHGADAARNCDSGYSPLHREQEGLEGRKSRVRALTRTRRVEGNPKEWKGREAEGRSGSKGRTFPPPKRVRLHWHSSHQTLSDRRCPIPDSRPVLLQYSPSSSSQLEEKSTRFIHNTLSHPYRRTLLLSSCCSVLL